MRVLILSQYFWPETFRINEVVESLRLAGCEVIVLTGQPNYSDGHIFRGYSAWGFGSERHPSGYEIYRTPVFPRGRNSGWRLGLNYISFALSSSSLGLWLTRRTKMDAVLVYGISPILQGVPGAVFRKIRSAVHVIWVQDLWPQSLEVSGYITDRWLLHGVRLLTSWIYRQADLLLVQSEAFVADVRSKAGHAVKIKYHPNPGDLSFSNDVGVTRFPKYRFEERFNVVFAGNLGRAQSLETIVGAALLLMDDPTICFIIFGSGSRLDWLRKEIGRHNLTNVKLAGRFPAEDMPAILSQASALLATLRRDDGLSQTIPSKISTYLAAGRPILASMDGEGARIVNEAVAGLTVPAEDAKSLSSAIIALQRMSPEKREIMGASGRAYFESHFSPSKLAKDLMQHLLDAIQERADKV